MKKNYFIILVLFAFLFMTVECNAKEAVNAGNKICPVTGDRIESMGGGTQVEYQGKIYNLCCPGCVETFKKNPDKYIKSIEQQMAQNAMEKKVKEFDLEAYQFSYEPDTITVNKGDDVRIHATSKDVPHGIYIKEYGINETVEKGKVTDVEFTADKAGEFDIICSVYCGPGHRNMKAKLIVKE